MLERLSSSHEVLACTGGVQHRTKLDYTVTIQGLEERIQIMEEMQQKVFGTCQQRENHWSMSIERHLLVSKMAKVCQSNTCLSVIVLGGFYDLLLRRVKFK